MLHQGQAAIEDVDETESSATSPILPTWVLGISSRAGGTSARRPTSPRTVSPLRRMTTGGTRKTSGYQSALRGRASAITSQLEGEFLQVAESKLKAKKAADTADEALK